MKLNLRQVLNDLREEKETIDETIAALERVLARQHKSSRKKPTESLSSPPSETHANNVASKKRNGTSGSPLVPKSLRTETGRRPRSMQ